MNDIAVSLATDQEARACLALMPRLAGLPVELLIARRDGAFAGAAALHWQSWSKPAGFPTHIHVLPPERRHGVGRRLLRAAADLAAEETDGLWTFEPMSPGGPAADFMSACGFEPLRRQVYFQASIEGLLAHITPLLQRLRRRAGGAAEARIGPVSDVRADDVAWLVSSALGGGPAQAMANLRRQAALGSESRDRSQAAMIDGAVAGVILWRIDDDNGVAVVEARAVSPRWRGGPVNLMLLEAGLLRGRAEGLTQVRFHCEDTVRDTISLARRAAAVQTATNAAYYYPIAAG